MKMTKMLLQDLAAKLKKSDYLVVDPKEHLAVVFSRLALFKHGEQRVKRIYRIMEDGTLESFNVNKAISEIIGQVADKVELNTLLKEVIRTSYPKDIIEALTLLKSGKPKISVAGKGCYSIMIGKGKKAVEFALSSK
jgi:hypothetical protein